MFADLFAAASRQGTGGAPASRRPPLQNRQQNRGVITVGGVPTCTLKWKFRNAPCSCSLPHLGGPTLTGPAGVISTCSCGGGGACALPGRTNKAAVTSASASKTTNLRIAPPFARGLEPVSLPHWKVVRNCTIVQFERFALLARASAVFLRAQPCPHSAPKRTGTASRSHAGSTLTGGKDC